MCKVGSVACVGFLVEGTGACVLVVGLDLVFLVGRAMAGGVFWGVCELSMTLGSLSTNGVVVFLSCCLFGMGHPALELAGCLVELGLSIETEISGRPLADLYYVGLGGFWWSNILTSTLPPQRLRPDTRPEHQDPVSHMPVEWFITEDIKAQEPQSDEEIYRVRSRTRKKTPPIFGSLLIAYNFISSWMLENFFLIFKI